MRARRVLLFASCLWLAAAPASHPESASPRALRVALHIHSTVSTGDVEPGRIVELAKQARLDAVIFTDSATRHWEYGIWPLQRLVKRVVEQSSVATYGAARYLDTVRRLNGEPAGILAIAGVEVTPFYYWQRSPFDRRGGQIRNWHQHLLVFGLHDASAIAHLPLNDFDPYHGNQGATPYQRLIDDVERHGGLVFWAHPEMDHVGWYGGVEAVTEPYPHLLEQTTDYQGFALTYLGRLTFVEPGKVWDRVLLAYCQGKRAKPVWVVGELDWRKPSERPLDQVLTLVQAAARSEEAILQAMREGRMWVVYRLKARAPVLERFEVSDLSGRHVATMGQHLAPTGTLRIRVSGQFGGTETQPVQVTIVRNGKPWHVEERGQDEVDVEWTDETPGTAGYYRIIVTSPAGLIYTNPIFVR